MKRLTRLGAVGLTGLVMAAALAGCAGKEDAAKTVQVTRNIILGGKRHVCRVRLPAAGAT
jgi:hypothetical protein